MLHCLGRDILFYEIFRKTNGLYYTYFYYFVWGFNLITVLFYPEVDFVEIWELKNPKGFQGFILFSNFLLSIHGCRAVSSALHYLLILKFRKLLSFCSPSSIFFSKSHSLQGSQKCDRKVWFLIYTRVSQIMTFHTLLLLLSLGEECWGYCRSKLNPLL